MGKIVKKPKEASEKPKESILDKANSLAVADDQGFLACSELLRLVKTLQAKVSETHDPVVANWHQKHKEALEEKKKDMVPLLEAETILKLKWAKYDYEQKKKQREEEERLKREAEREEEERRMLTAANLIEEGREEEANRLLEEPIEVNTAILPVSRPVVTSGVGSRSVWSAEILALPALLQAILDGKAPVEAIEPNMMFLNGQARLRKHAGMIYPGVVAVEGSSVSAGKL